MEPDPFEWAKINLFLGVICCAIAFIAIPKPQFEELAYVSGEIVSVETKGDGGKIFTIKSGRLKTGFIIPNSTFEQNEKIKGVVNGDLVQIWYLASPSLYKGRFEAWQVSIGSDVVIPYARVLDETIAYQWILSFFSVIFLGLSLLLYAKKKQS